MSYSKYAYNYFKDNVGIAITAAAVVLIIALGVMAYPEGPEPPLEEATPVASE